MSSSLSAIILAGGQSSRMGRDKALIKVGGIPLLRRTCEVALQCASQVFVVTSWTGKYAEIVPDRCFLMKEKLLPNQSKPQGPLIGFAQGLAQVETEWVLLLACDLPGLNRDILQGWMLQLAQVNEVAALLPQSRQGWEPLCGFYRSDRLPSLTQFIQQGGRSFQGWLDQESVEAIRFSDEPEKKRQEQAMLFNCNTPEDLEQILTGLG
jgi:molybdopterin-guanine dinucleotide biosynthesis protein A